MSICDLNPQTAIVMLVQVGLASLGTEEGPPDVREEACGRSKGSGMACLCALQLTVCSHSSAKWPGLGFRPRVAKTIAGQGHSKLTKDHKCRAWMGA